MTKRNIQFSHQTSVSWRSTKYVGTTFWLDNDGPRTKDFERKLSEYCGTSKTVCLNSATAALELTLRILGVGPGDEVITSAYTYTSSASVIDHVGAKIVLVDVEPGTYHIDYNALADAITDKTKLSFLWTSVV
jgi:dTDP-4-amino-4,6-dideoxygalactose transaminase